MMQQAVAIKRAGSQIRFLWLSTMTGQDIVDAVSTFAERVDFDGATINQA